MIDILQYLPPRTRKSPSGWFTFNAPCCIHNGETPDKRKRGGIIFDGEDWSYHCFNCGYKARFVHGQSLSLKAKNLLKWIGVPEDTIQKINLDSIRHKKIYDVAKDRTDSREEIIQKNIFFEEVELPTTARAIMQCDQWAIDYLENERGLDYRDYPFKITPQESGRNNRRILIPYQYAGEIVGWTSRYLDNRTPKYLNENQQPGYIFGMEMQKPDWDYIIVVEGVFCAISIRGVAVLHNEMNEQQMALLRRQGKEVIVVPDQDKAGLTLVEEALEAGFSVSIPDWPMHVKDTNDAVKEFGRLGTLISIIANKTSSKVRAKVMLNNLIRRKKLVK
jgi:DNA primase